MKLDTASVQTMDAITRHERAFYGWVREVTAPGSEHAVDLRPRVAEGLARVDANLAESLPTQARGSQTQDALLAHELSQWRGQTSSESAPGVVATVPEFGYPARTKHTGQVAVVTGGNRGIGFELCRQLALQGFTVVLTARDPVLGREAAEQLRAEGHDVVFEQLDVMRPKQAEALADACLERFGSVDVLINNAGVSLDPRQDLTPLAKQIRSFKVNFYGPMRVTAALTPLLAKANGRVINISSEVSTCHFEEVLAPAYQSSKAALNAQTRLDAERLGLLGISVNAVDPGWVQTAMGGGAAPDTPLDGVQATMWVATTDGPPTGGFFRRHIDPPPPSGEVQIARVAW
ncbi:SDR family NAD(P)-dependent oxidoreductase [Myxococcota bacterium]